MKRSMWLAALLVLASPGAFAIDATDLAGVYAGNSVTNNTHCQASIYRNGPNLEIRVQDQYDDLVFPSFPAEDLTRAIGKGYSGSFYLAGPSIQKGFGQGEYWFLDGNLRPDGTIRFITVAHGISWNLFLGGQTNVICQVEQKVAN